MLGGPLSADPPKGTLIKRTARSTTHVILNPKPWVQGVDLGELPSPA